ncbi:MAG TPA: hypothetical protein VFO77_05940 [Actinoplanes sp.]|nr:hypothetical protein [Actinoplanes sp.]
MPEGLQAGLIVVLGVAAVVVALVIVQTAVRDRSPIPVLVLLGALLCVAYEPIGDMLVLAYYPELGQITWVTLFGRGIPVFIGLMYVGYIAPFVLLFEHLHRRGFTIRSWWTLWAGTAGAIVVIEIVVMRFGDAWVYYGSQRLVVAGLPLWTPITYASFLLAIACGVHGLAARLRPGDRWLIVPAVPALLAGAHVSTSLPAAAALYSTSDATLILAGALGSVAACGTLVHALSRFFVAEPAGRPTPPSVLQRTAAP